MDFGGGEFFRPFRRFGPSLQPSEGRGVIMDWTTWSALISTVALVLYLTVALLKPEKFS